MPLSDLHPPRHIRKLHALILGIEPPKPIAETSLILSILYLGDTSLPTGLELRLWNKASLQAASLRPLDVVCVQNAYLKRDENRNQVYLTPHTGFEVKRVSCEAADSDAGGVFEWRRERFGQVLKWTEQGKMQRRPLRTGMKREREVRMEKREEKREIGNVKVKSVRMKDGIRELVRRVCPLCTRRFRPYAKACNCGIPLKWGWGELWLVVESAQECLEVCAKGEVTDKLMLGADAKMTWEQSERIEGAKGVLRALVEDVGMRIVVEGTELKDLYID